MYKILGKLTAMGPCAIQNRNSNKKTRKKTKNKMYTPHHTISHKHAHLKSGKQVKTDENFSPAGRLWLHYENARVNVTTQPASREKQALERPRILSLPASTSRTFQRTLAGENTHHPASVMISSHSVSLHDFILNKTSYASYA